MRRVASACLLAGLSMGLAGCFASEEEEFARCPEETKRLIEKKIGPVEKFDLVPATAEELEVLPYHEGTAVVDGEEYSFTCHVGPKGGLLISVDDPNGDTILDKHVTDYAE